MFNKILIANRGEIACRIAETCRELGVQSVGVYSDTDATARHVRVVDEAWPLGGATPAESYLRGEKILEIAQAAGAEAIHPGYGFLSENAEFARQCEAAGIVFIGPKAATIDQMGSKAAAKELMAKADVPVVPGYQGEDQSDDVLHNAAKDIGFPLMIKASAGGGGKGMRIVREAGDFDEALESARREARNAFGDDRVILERYLQRPRHIEFQVFADSHGNALHLGERECSVQRRYQKIIEETPSPVLDEALRARMGEAAVKAARAVDYLGAGTVEFIFEDGEFFFMEMNTRLQVEHPVTECVTGFDLVAWQLDVAAGKPLPVADQADIVSFGHAIEARVYAEDADANFMPSTGHIDHLQWPEGVRIDAGVETGDAVSVHYDPMIAKLIVHAEDRPRALAGMEQALAQSHLSGLTSNLGFLQRLCRLPAFRDGDIDTGYLDRDLDSVLEIPASDAELLDQLAGVAALLLDEQADHDDSPWARRDGFRMGPAEPRELHLEYGDVTRVVRASGHSGNYDMREDDDAIECRAAVLCDGVLRATLNGRMLQAHCHHIGSEISLSRNGARRLYRSKDPAADAGAVGVSDDAITAPMPATVIAVKVSEGDAVEEGQVLAVLEAMKMEMSLKAPHAGTVESVNAAEGDFVEADTVVVQLTEQSGDEA